MRLRFLFGEGRRAAGRADAKSRAERLHNARTAPAPTVRAARRQQAEGRRGRAVDAFAAPGSFYTFREVGLILSSSPTDCSCCCRCSDPADHVARHDLGAGSPGRLGHAPPGPGDSGDGGAPSPCSSAPSFHQSVLLLALRPLL